MRYLLIALLTLQAQAKEPKFYKHQKVIYEVGYFLHKVCSGKGVVSDMETDGINNTYQISTPMDEDECPVRVERKEDQIKSAE